MIFSNNNIGNKRNPNLPNLGTSSWTRSENKLLAPLKSKLTSHRKFLKIRKLIINFKDESFQNKFLNSKIFEFKIKRDIKYIVL